MKQKEALKALDKLTKWRSVFAGWQLGTRSKDDPECQAVRDHREATIVLRVEVSALTNLLIEKGVFTREEFFTSLGREIYHLDKAFEKFFPGASSTDLGMAFNIEKATGWMKNWRP